MGTHRPITLTGFLAAWERPRGTRVTPCICSLFSSSAQQPHTAGAGYSMDTGSIAGDDCSSSDTTLLQLHDFCYAATQQLAIPNTLLSLALVYADRVYEGLGGDSVSVEQAAPELCGCEVFAACAILASKYTEDEDRTANSRWASLVQSRITTTTQAARAQQAARTPSVVGILPQRSFSVPAVGPTAAPLRHHVSFDAAAPQLAAAHQPHHHVSPPMVMEELLMGSSARQQPMSVDALDMTVRKMHELQLQQQQYQELMLAQATHIEAWRHAQQQALQQQQQMAAAQAAALAAASTAAPVAVQVPPTRYIAQLELLALRALRYELYITPEAFADAKATVEKDTLTVTWCMLGLEQAGHLPQGYTLAHTSASPSPADYAHNSTQDQHGYYPDVHNKAEPQYNAGAGFSGGADLLAQTQAVPTPSVTPCEQYLTPPATASALVPTTGGAAGQVFFSRPVSAVSVSGPQEQVYAAARIPSMPLPATAQPVTALPHHLPPPGAVPVYVAPGAVPAAGYPQQQQLLQPVASSSWRAPDPVLSALAFLVLAQGSSVGPVYNAGMGAGTSGFAPGVGLLPQVQVAPIPPSQYYHVYAQPQQLVPAMYPGAVAPQLYAPVYY